MTIIPSTCKEEGYTLFECICGNSYITNYTELKEHSYGEWNIVTEPTDETEGYKYQICIECNYKNEEVIPSNAHVHNYSIMTPT